LKVFAIFLNIRKAGWSKTGSFERKTGMLFAEKKHDLLEAKLLNKHNKLSKTCQAFSRERKEVPDK
jgi:hypothetical protein